MLRSMNELINYTLAATDGEIGRCKDFFFDDELWTIRYMVADTNKWLPGRRVLISPLSLGEPEWANRLFPIQLTQDQIKEAPDIDADAPVNRWHEKQLAKYYGYAPYWAGPYTWGAMDIPQVPFTRQALEALSVADEAQDYDKHLRSCKEITGYHIHASDGQVGHVENFILDDRQWTIRYLVVDTRNWLPGRHVLITPVWVTLVEWFDRKVQLNLTVEQIKNSPAYDPNAPVNREYEERLYDYYGKPKYWV